MLSYVKQAAVCNSVRELLSERGMAGESDMNSFPSVHEVLRATHLFSHIEDDRALKEAVVERLLERANAQDYA